MTQNTGQIECALSWCKLLLRICNPYLQPFAIEKNKKTNCHSLNSLRPRTIHFGHKYPFESLKSESWLYMFIISVKNLHNHPQCTSLQVRLAWQSFTIEDHRDNRAIIKCHILLVRVSEEAQQQTLYTSIHITYDYAINYGLYDTLKYEYFLNCKTLYHLHDKFALQPRKYHWYFRCKYLSIYLYTLPSTDAMNVWSCIVL